MRRRPMTNAILEYPMDKPALEVAALVGCSLQQVYYARRTGRLTPVGTANIGVQHFAPRPAPRFDHCIHVVIRDGEAHECGEPTGGRQRCEEHRYSHLQGSRFPSVKTIRHTA